MRDEDIEPVLDLLRASLGEPPLLGRTRELFEWKHRLNPFGQSLAIVAETDNRIVGLRAFMRWDLATPEGETVKCVRAVDTATHPAYQRLGIFKRLTEEAVEEARAQDIDLIFNTPNNKSGPGYLQMGWLEVGKIEVLIRPKRRFLTKTRPTRSEGTTGLIPNCVTPTPDGIQDRAAVGVRTVRTGEYIRWRFASHPTARYCQIRKGNSSAIVRPNVRSGRSEVLIADLFGPNPRGAILESIREAQSGYVAASFTRGAPERAACVRAGMVVVPFRNPLTLMARPLKDLTFDVSSLRAWDLSLGDLELL